MNLVNTENTPVACNNVSFESEDRDKEAEAAQTKEVSTKRRRGIPKYALEPCWCIKQEREGEAANPGPDGENEEPEGKPPSRRSFSDISM